MGLAWIHMKKVGKKKCGGAKAGSFHHVHNLKGSGGWSASVSLGIFSLNYQKDAPKLELTKSAKYSNYN